MSLDEGRVRIVDSHSDYPAPDGFTTIGREGAVLGADPLDARRILVALDRDPAYLPHGLTVSVYPAHVEAVS